MAWTPADAGDKAGSLSQLVPCMPSMGSVARKGLGKSRRYAPFSLCTQPKDGPPSTARVLLASPASLSAGGIIPRGTEGGAEELAMNSSFGRTVITQLGRRSIRWHTKSTRSASANQGLSRHSATETSDAALPPTDDSLFSPWDETALHTSRVRYTTCNNSAYSSRPNSRFT